ncbi:endopeptidase La [candidate division WOR-3 bacterium]|nr:endopeptidase La [candidate division WOR-3 bacterium]
MILPLLVLEKQIIYPNLPLVVIVSRQKDIDMINDILKSRDKTLVAALKKEDLPEGSSPEKYIFDTGVISLVTKLMNYDDNYRIIIQGRKRVRINKIVEEEKFTKAEVFSIEDSNETGVETEALHRSLQNTFIDLIEETPAIPQELKIVIKEIDKPGSLADFVSMHINMDISDRQKILETPDVRERIRFVLEKVIDELEIARVASKIRKDVEEKAEDSRKEYFLREQMKAIKKELGEKDDSIREISDLREKIQNTNLSEEALKACQKEVERLNQMPPASAEYSVSRTYIDWILDLPWGISTKDKANIRNAKNILDADHYDLKDVKERILEFIAVRKLKSDVKSPIICFLGPPGVGKTSLGQSIAKTLGRKFVRFSLGGIRDEAEIRGHRRTYVGAMPGRIIQGIRRAESSNPLFMLDEIDKLGVDFRGDPASALLEVLDPEQNFSFRDHYLDLSFDLSKVLFIMTANTTATIPPALLDRMEIIELPGYTNEEKIEIAKQHLLPRQIRENGLEDKNIFFENEAIQTLISNYTFEAGVRNLERNIASVCRKIAKKIASTSSQKSKLSTVTGKTITKLLGPPRHVHEKKLDSPQTGISTGLAWTPNGGEILFIESIFMPGKGNLILTGQLGDVMKESAMAALTYLKSIMENKSGPDDFFKDKDFHIHVPAGAIPKDGPSAGVAIVSALYSRINGIKLKNDVAMTGEITLSGRVLPVGGIENKVLAAKRSGINTVILPKDNAADFSQIPPEKKKGIKPIFVDSIEKVLKNITYRKEEKIDKRSSKAGKRNNKRRKA